MATAQTLINGALRDLKVLSSGQSPTAQESADSLEALNAMLESWSLESLLVYYWPTEGFSLTGAESYTIGSGGDFDTTRPTFIRSAYLENGNVTYPIDVLGSRDGYDRIYEKSAGGIPDRIFYEPNYPLGKIYVWPVGSSADTLYITTQQQPLSQFSALTDTVILPPGYQRAIRANLAIELSAEFDSPVSEETAVIAMKSKGELKRMNRTRPRMRYDSSIPSGRRYNINTD